MRQLLIIPFMLLLVACAPREACLSNATRELLTVRSLISVSEGNLSRGYGLRPTETSTEYLAICPGTGGKYGPIVWCENTHTSVKKVPVALDLAVQRRKLRDLRQKESQLAGVSKVAIQQCEQQHLTG